MGSVSLVNGHVDDDMPTMTPQEAIEFIKNEIHIDVRFCSNAKIDKTIEACNLAISALEKQIPKKPTIKKSVKVNAFTLRCPNCEAVLQADSPCCRYCGQALDWSDTE